ncbi:hypothetical protein ABLG96_05100 [Nakamurella sp. A5-74]|uniref:TetR family transcriptional regulator n=1 Tax=Nakamurella sp. A5-74 TaxID=3158264 RepID=A0AAU8DRQ6_9ACTN
MSQTEHPAAVPFRGRQPRLTQAHVQERLLDTGSRMVAGAGLTVGLDHLRYEEVIVHAGVSRSAAYRCFPNKDAFHARLLCTLADSSWAGVAAFDAQTISVAVRTVVRRRAELGTPDGRAAVMMDACRLAGERNFRSLVTTPGWRTYIALNAALLSMPDGQVKTDLAAALSRAETKFIDLMASFYRAMGKVIGMRLRPEFGDDYRSMAALSAAVLEGLGLRHALNPGVTSARFATAPFDIHGPDSAAADTEDADTDWSLGAIGYAAIISSMSEPDPDWEPSFLDPLDEMAANFLLD